MTPIILVFTGGGIGSVLRYLTGLACARVLGTSWPWGTFCVNVLGCFCMGLFFRLLPLPELGPPSTRLLLMTGVLGGFTTFSAFALDSAHLWMRQETQSLLLYVAGSFVSTLAAVALGLICGKALSS